MGITTLHVSGSLSAHHQDFLAVHRLWYILCRFDDRLLPGIGWNCSSIVLLVANGHQICIKCTKADVRLRTPDDEQKGCSSTLLLVANGHQNCIKCTKADVRLRNPDDGQKGCPKHVEL